jgi:hypothetical protein
MTPIRISPIGLRGFCCRDDDDERSSGVPTLAGSDRSRFHSEPRKGDLDRASDAT